MANEQAEVIVAGLDDNALRKSIENLVNVVNENTKTMAQSFNNAMTSMEEAFKRLTLNSESSAKKRANDTKKEAEAAQQAAVSYNELANAAARVAAINSLTAKNAGVELLNQQFREGTSELQKMSAAMDELRQKSYQQSFNSQIYRNPLKDNVSEIQQLRMQQHQLESEIKRMQNISMQQGIAEYNRLGQEIDRTRQQIQSLRNEQEQLKRTTPTNRHEQDALLQKYNEIGKEIDKLKEKEKELISTRQGINVDTMQAEKLAQLQTMYDAIGQKIRDMGSAMQQNAAAEQASLEREQQIAQILQSKATAQDAYMRATKMPTNTYDEAIAKLKQLELVQEALNKKTILPESTILRLGRVIDDTKEKIKKLEVSEQQMAQATSTTQSAINQQAQAMRQIGVSAEESARRTIVSENEKREAIMQTGFAAQQTAQQIISSMYNQSMANTDTPIMGLRELSKAINEMRNAYYSMGSQMESPIGQALRRDIEEAERAREAVKRYNQELMALSSPDMKKIASLQELREEINALSYAYSWMRKNERQSAQGQELIDKYQKTTRAAKELEQQLNRPISLDKALALPANTLNEISYKLQMLSNYRSGLNYETQAKEIQQVTAAMDALEKKQRQIMGQNKELADSNNWLSRSFQYMKNRLAFYFTIGASTQFVKNLIEIRSQYEMTERALGILVDSAERGSQIFNELSSMALQSPYTLIELSNAAKQLTAYDVAAKDVVDTTRRLADMSAAVGINIDRLTYALGQVKAYGYLNARDARMFANAGIPLVKQLADYYTELEGRMVSVGDVYDRIKKKAVGYEDTMAVITKMTDEGGKFFDFQAKMADTLKVQLANLTLAWNNMLNEIGKSNSGLLTAPIKGMKALFSSWKQIQQVFYDVMWTLGAVGLARALATLSLRLIGVRMESYATAIAGKRLGIAIAGVGKAFMALMTNPWTWILAVGAALADLALNASRVKESAEQLSAAIEKSAEESIKSLKKFREVNEDSIGDLYANLLKPDEIEKLWESIKEELENSADSASNIIPKLMAIPDLSERVKTSLEWSKRIDEANEALKNMGTNLIKINTDLAWGAFGEGVVSDIKDWASAIYAYKDILKKGEKPNEDSSYWEQEEEAIKEIGKVAIQVAQVVERELGKEGMKDRIKVGEAVARIKQQIKLENPEIQGEVAKLFDMQLDEMLGERWGNVYDSTTRLWQDLMSEVKKDSSSAFQELSQEWLDGTEKMTNEQKKAFTDAANHLKETLPPAMHETLDRMLADMNSRTFRINVGIAFDVKQLDAIQRDFNKRFLGSASGTGEIKAPMGLSVEGQRDYIRKIQEEQQKYTRLNKKEGESTLAWQKRLTDEYKSQNDNLKLQEKRYKQTSGVVQADAQAQIKSSKEILSILKEIGDYEGFDVTGAKDKKGGKKTTKKTTKSEDLVAKALREEISLINEMRSNYDKLRKAGMDANTALTESSTGYEKSIAKINQILKKFGIEEFNVTNFVGKDADVNTLFNNLKAQLDSFVSSGKVKLESLKALEEEIAKVRIEADVYNLDKITKGLNNELDKIKEEYELAVQLEANPELGGIFADLLGISQEELEELPKDWQGMLNKMQAMIDQTLGKVGFSLIDNLNKANFDEWVNTFGAEMDSGLIKALDDMRQAVNNARQEETKQIVEEWEKLLEKYAEYESKRSAIAKEAERERAIATKHNAGKEILDAINKKELQAYAKLDFDEFQKSATWITATGNLSNLADSAIELLIKRITEYKKRAKDLEPKEILKLNKALRQLRKEQMKDNPFKIYSIAAQEAKERAEEYDAEIAELQRQIDSMGLSKKRKEGIVITKEEQDILDKLLEKIAELKEEKAEAGKIPLIKKIEQVQAYVDLFKQFSDTFKNFADSTNNHDLKQVAKAISDVVDVVGSALAGAKTMGGWWGAVIGGVTALIPKILDWVSGNDDINYSIERSQVAIKRLANIYKELEYNAQKAYGVEEYGAKKALILNKQMQLAELERQLTLEQSRKGKYRDQSAIEDLKGQIIDMKNEINSATEDIVNDLLGISSKGDFAEQLVKDMINAFKEGEDYMKVFEESFEDMVDNMIMKAIVSRLVGDWINSIWDKVNAKAAQSDRALNAQNEIERWENRLNYLKSGEVRQGRGYATEEQIARWIAEAEENLANAVKAYNDAITPTPEDIAGMRDLFEQGREDFKNNFLAYMDAFGITFGQNAGKADLSSLQQGIQGITEETAGALEAYMNEVSQQVYYQSDILTQIRDILVNFGGDVTLATNSQILFELQQSYQVQMTIQSILQGWSTPSGLAVRVEMQ